MIAAQLLVAQRALRKAHQDPIALARRQPHANLLPLAVTELKSQHHFAGLRCRRQLDQSGAVIANLEARLATQASGERIALDSIKHVLGLIRLVDLEFAAQALAYGATVLVGEAHRDDRSRLAVGGQL